MLTRTATLALSALSISPLNARSGRDYAADEALEGLASSIHSTGLLHPLVVHELKKAGTYGVLAGGRRLAALGLLLAAEKITADEEIPVTILTGTAEELRQASIAENFQRAEMTDVEIYQAVRAATSGKAGKKVTDEQLADSLGITVNRVQRWRRLAHVHPDVMAAYVAREIQPNTLKTLALEADPMEQVRWLAKLKDGTIYSHNLRSAMGFSHTETNTQLKIVGAEAYEAAGGTLTRDLFSDGDDARVDNPELLAELMTAVINAKKDEVRAAFPDRVFEFADEPPQTSGGYDDYQLKAVPGVSDALIEEIEGLEMADAELWEELGDLLTQEQMDDPTIWDETGEPDIAAIAAIVTDETAKQLAEQMLDVRKRLAELDAQPKTLPDGATLCVIRPERGELTVTWWFSDRKAAGLTERATASNSVSSDAPKPAKPGEEGFDPDQPPLTQKAQDHIKGMRANQALRWTQDECEPARETARRAHLALIFAMAWKERHPYGSRDDSGLVYGFGGQGYQYAGTSIGKPDAPDAPGLDNLSMRAGFFRFEHDATPEQVDRLAAWLFARRVEPSLADKGTLATDVFTDLSIPSYARGMAQPDLDEGFFKLFTKKVLIAFAGMMHKNHATGASSHSAADLPARTARFFSPSADDCRIFGIPDPSKHFSWIPAPLRWRKPVDVTDVAEAAYRKAEEPTEDIIEPLPEDELEPMSEAAE